MPTLVAVATNFTSYSDLQDSDLFCFAPPPPPMFFTPQLQMICCYKAHYKSTLKKAIKKIARAPEGRKGYKGGYRIDPEILVRFRGTLMLLTPLPHVCITHAYQIWYILPICKNSTCTRGRNNYINTEVGRGPQ